MEKSIEVMSSDSESILIGTSGYDYPEWKGVFYPEKLPRKDFLSYYSTQFNALELNNTFYSMPTAERLLSFYERSEGRLQFSIKANRLLTHEISYNWKSAAVELKNALEPLYSRSVLSTVLFQFPQSFHYTKENRFYLADLVKEFTGYPVVVEFRHEEWIIPSVIQGLEQRNISIAFCDMPQLKNLPDGFKYQTPFTGDIAYIRLHGRNYDAWYATGTDKLLKSGEGIEADSDSNGVNGSERYRYDYSEDELLQFVPVIQIAQNVAGKSVSVFFNNHPNGYGAKNGKKLKELLKERN